MLRVELTKKDEELVRAGGYPGTVAQCFKQCCGSGSGSGWGYLDPDGVPRSGSGFAILIQEDKNDPH
jgi:hypothetical protein